MKIRTAAALFLTAILAPQAGRGAALALCLEAGMAAGFGGSAYDLAAEDVGSEVLSRLEFPLDSPMVALSMGLAAGDPSRPSWLFNLSLARNLSSPSGLMLDYDWVKPEGYPRIPFSYTESEVEGESFQLEVRAARRLWASAGFACLLSAGYRYQLIVQDILGYKGWQYVWNDTLEAYDLHLVSSILKALHYELTLHAPMLGAAFSWHPHPRFTASLSTHYLLVFASDLDDHLLRSKLSTSSGVGHGFAASFSARYTLGAPGGRTLPYLALEGSFLTLRVDTTQRQEWYGDDPGFPGDETGMVFTGIDHEITSTQFQIGLTAGIEF